MDHVSLSSAGRLFQMTAADTLWIRWHCSCSLYRQFHGIDRAQKWLRPASVENKMQSTANYDREGTRRRQAWTVRIRFLMGASGGIAQYRRGVQWLKWFCEAGGAHLTKPGWSKPRTHSNPTNLALFRHKMTRYRFNQGGGSYYCRGLKWEQGAEPPSL